MLRKFLLEVKARHLQALHEQKGQSIIIFTFAFLGLLAMLGLALDLSLVYIEKVKVNRAADASALAAVVELPYEQDTINRAIDYIRLNGYDVGVDTSILVRGCVVSPTTYIDSQNVSHVYTPSGAGNISEGGFNTAITRTTLITGVPYITATRPVKAIFVVDTGAYQASSTNNCGGTSNILGTASKLRVAGRVYVPMHFMQFFGFGQVPVEDSATAENLTSLDIMVVFDISGSMEDQTICNDCWVRNSYVYTWPNNGYFNPIPYDPNLATAYGADNQSVISSTLCQVYPPVPYKPSVTSTLQYLTVEAELYSRNVSNWDLSARTPGQGFWAIQRGSKLSGNNALGENNEQKNAEGVPASQSSNLCRPNVTGGPAAGIDCTLNTGGAGDNICDSSDGGIARDCSSYIAARPFETYGQVPGAIPNLSGASYNADCFSGPNLSGNCWSSSPFAPVVGNGPSTVPYVEYDFTPTWTQTTTYVWVRAIGGGQEAYTWAGSSPDQLQPDYNGGGLSNNVAPWRKVIYWQVVQYNTSGSVTTATNVTQRKDNLNPDWTNNPNYVLNPDDDETSYFQPAMYAGSTTSLTWRDNRAQNYSWRWIKIGSTSTVSGTQYTLRIYQGSPGYKIDKIVFTNDSSGSTPEASASVSLPTALLRKADGTTATSTDYGNQLGPPASWGSATREACNKCNPAFGYTVNPNECTCKLKANDTANGGYGSGKGCSAVLTTTNQLQAQVLSGLYSGLQPIRSVQEAIKRFAAKLNPKFDQLGLVPFTADSGSVTDNTTAQGSSTRRSKLQCLVWSKQSDNLAPGRTGNPGSCYDSSIGTPLTYTNVLSAAEKQWPNSGTNIAVGLQQGLVELGINEAGFVSSTSQACSTLPTDGKACDRGGAAKRVLVLMTDGSPNSGGSLCTAVASLSNWWKGQLGNGDSDFACAMYFAYLAAKNDVVVYTIGIGAGANRDYLSAIATGVDPSCSDDPNCTYFTGKGGQYFPAAKPTDLDLIFSQILSNIYVRIVG